MWPLHAATGWVQGTRRQEYLGGQERRKGKKGETRLQHEWTPYIVPVVELPTRSIAITVEHHELRCTAHLSKHEWCPNAPGHTANSPSELLKECCDFQNSLLIFESRESLSKFYLTFVRCKPRFQPPGTDGDVRNEMEVRLNGVASR